MRAVLPFQGRFCSAGAAAMLAGAFLLLPVTLFAQNTQPQEPKPTAAVQKLLDDALKIKDNAQRLAALKPALEAAKAANDVEGQAEAESALGGASQPSEAIPWFEAAITGFKSTLNSRQQGIALKSLGNCYIALGRRDKAIETYNQAVPVSRGAGDTDTVGRILSNLGDTYWALGQPQKALDDYAQALPALKAAGDKPIVAHVVGSLAFGYKALGQLQKSLDYYKQLLSSAQQAHDADQEGQVLENIGVMYASVGQNQKALEYMNRALPILREVGDRPSQAHALSDIGVTYANLGQQQKALDYYKQALPIEKEVGDKQSMGKTLGNIGMVSSALGRLQSALDYFDQAVSIFKDLGDKQSLAIGLINIGNIYRSLGEDQKALDYCNQALPIEKEIGNIQLEGLTLNNLAQLYQGEGQRSKALELYNQAITIEKSVGDRPSVGKMLTNMGAVYADLGQKTEALEHYEEALAIFRDIGDRGLAGVVLTNIGAIDVSLGERRRALTDYNEALSNSRQVGDRTTEANILGSVSDLLGSEKRPALAIVFAKQSVNTYQDLRKDIRGLSKEDQDAYSKKVEPAYRHLADLLIKQGRLREAEKVMSLLKDEENFEFVARDAAIAKGADARIESIGAEAGWWDSYRKLQDKALKIDSDEFDLTQNASKLRASSALSPEQKTALAKIDAQLKELDAQKDVLDKAADAYFDEVGKDASALRESIRKEAEERVRQTGDELPSLLGRIHRTTAEKIGAVYALATTDELDFLIVTYAGRAHVSVPVKADDLNKMISEFRKRLMNPNEDPKPAGEKLYQLVFEKVIHQLRDSGCTRVVWCLDGTLRYVPIGALWDGERYLIERGDYTMFDPLNLDRMSAEASKSLLAAGFAATEGKGETFAPLPGADRELKSVVKDDSQAGFSGAVPGRAWENKSFDANNLTFAMKGEQFSILHIATHFNVGKDFNSSDLLLGDGTLLSLKQFTDAGAHGRLGHLDLVCLSACDTAESFGDAASSGSQFSSFVSLTLKDGASAVVASLWPVSDESTPILMQRFYADWMASKQKGKAAALRAAQLSLLHGDAKFNHPYYWAPFVLFGNWN